MGEAIGIGALAASSLLAGAVLALLVKLPERLVGLLLAFGAGALISSVSLELAEEAVDLGGLGLFAAGLAAGAVAFYAGDRALEGGSGRRRPARSGAKTSSGSVLALGALLDGIPEQAVLGIGLAAGEPANVALLAAIFVSNLPEAIGSAADLRRDGRPPRDVLGLWAAVTVVGVAATAAGFALMDGASSEVRAVVTAFAAGAVLCMLVDSMIPEARREGGRSAGLVTVLGFAVAVALSGA